MDFDLGQDVEVFDGEFGRFTDTLHKNGYSRSPILDTPSQTKVSG